MNTRRWIAPLALLLTAAAPAPAQEVSREAIAGHRPTAGAERRLMLHATAARAVAVNRDLVAITAVVEEDQEKALAESGLGPREPAIPLQDHLTIANLQEFGLSPQDIVSLSLTVYPDANPDSGIFYYRPNQYFLHWTPEDQYYLAIDYKPEQDTAKNVVLDARLTPGPVSDDVAVLTKLLDAHLRTRPQRPPRISLLPLPARYEAFFDWTTLGVAGEDITVTGVDPDSRQFGLQVVTDVATKELLIGKLADPTGLTGNVRVVPQQVTPEQAALAPFTVQARLKLADNQAYSRSAWRRGGSEYSSFRNERPLPVRLEHLVYLVEQGGRLRLRGYDLGGQRLLPGDVAKLPNASIHDEIAGPTAIRAWYSYTLENDAAHREALLAELTGGVGAIPVTDVDIQIVRAPELFEQFSLFKIAIVVRSKFFDPTAGSSQLLEKGYEFSPEVARAAVAPLYRPVDSVEPLYEYRIGVVTGDGTPHVDAQWRRPTAGFANSVFIGSSQIEEVLAQ